MGKMSWEIMLNVTVEDIYKGNGMKSKWKKNQFMGFYPVVPISF